METISCGAQQNFVGLYVWDKPDLSGYLVYLVHPVSLMQPNEQERLAGVLISG
jgi:hypothetical protein